MTVRSQLEKLGVERVVLYGYKKPTHTHFWIQNAFHRALLHLGMKVLWADNRDNLKEEDISGSLVLGNINTDRVDLNLPLSPRAYYLMHVHAPGRLDTSAYNTLAARGRCAFFEVFRGRKYDSSFESVPGEPCHFRSLSKADLAMVWATDLLPHEIEKNEQAVVAGNHCLKKPSVCFVGSIWRVNMKEVQAMIDFAISNGLRFEQYGQYVSSDFPRVNRPDVSFSVSPLSVEKNIELIQEALLAPAVQGEGQLSNPDSIGNYIPCRILKNISYGAFGITNNPSARELLGDGVICNRNIPELLTTGLTYLSGRPDNSKLLDAMRDVRSHHTYLNRLETMLKFLIDCRDASPLGNEMGGSEARDLKRLWKRRRMTFWISKSFRHTA